MVNDRPYDDACRSFDGMYGEFDTDYGVAGAVIGEG